MHSATEELSRRKSYFSRESIEQARLGLRQLPRLDTTQNLRTLVAQLFETIREKREANLSWSAIHKAINAEVPIGLRTLMLYFADEEREHRRKAVVAAYAQIERRRAERMPWAQILASLPKLRMSANALRTTFEAERRARKANPAAK